MTERIFDVLVVGSGPAGSLFAKQVSPSLSVCVIDRPRGENGFRKACGGLLSPDARRSLRRLGLEVPSSVLVDPAPDRVRTVSVETGRERAYPRNYTNMDRDLFDKWLKSLIPETVVLVEGVCTDVQKRDGIFCVSVLSDGQRKDVLAREIVGADGGGSLVRKKLIPTAKIRSYTAIQEWYPEEGTASGYACVFDPKTTDCCAWSISKNGRLVYGGAFPSKDCKKRFEEHLTRVAPFGYDFSTPLYREACVVFRPRTLSELCFGQDGVYLVGEAAGLISPSSLEGISFAIDSGEALAKAFSEPREHRLTAYRKAVKPLKRKIFKRLLKVPFMYVPWLRNLVLISGVTAVKTEK